MAQQMPDPSELFPLLLSNDLHVIQEIKALIQDSLNSARDPGFLNALVDFYIHTNSHNALDLLAGVREPLDKPMMDRLNDNMKVGHKLQSLTLLSHVVRHQPSWLHKIVQAPLFPTLLHCLKTDTDIPVIMCGLLTVTTLLPMIPSLVSPFLPDIFRVFSHLASWTVKKPGSIPDVYQLHIQVAVYALFHRLYGMYPWNFLQYLRTYYQNRTGEFKSAVLPMLERVRMHPLLVIGSAHSETEKKRWRQMEVHDVLMECARVSLDTTESARDDSFSYTPAALGYDLDRFGPRGVDVTGQAVMRTSSPVVDSQGTQQSHKPLIQWDNDSKRREPDAQSLVPSLEGGITMFSPSMVCGLSTPPQDQSRPPSPQGSQLDVSLTSSVQLHYTTPHVETPTPLSTPRESPYPSAASRLSSRMSSMSDGSVHHGRKAKGPLGKLPPVATQSAANLGRTVSAPVTPGYETRSLPVTPQKPLAPHAKAASHEIITKQRRFVWDEAHLADALPSNGDLTPTSSSTKLPAEDAEGEDSQTRFERAESSVSLKDLPEVIKDLNTVEERRRDDDAINKEVSSFTADSPCTVLNLESSTGSYKIHQMQSKTILETGDLRAEKPKPVTAVPAGSSKQPNGTKTQEEELGHRVHSTGRPETVRTQSDPSASHRNSAIRSFVESETRPRTSSFGSKQVGNVSADLFGAGKLRNGVLTSEPGPTYQGFMPIVDNSESPILRQSAQSAASEPLTATPGLQMPYLHLFSLILPSLQNLNPATGGFQGSREHSPSVSSANSTGGGGLYATPPPTSRAESVLSAGTSADAISTVPLHSLYSPSQLLDRHLQLGSQTHDEQLTGLPLTCQESVDWTHFGGSPPVDEIKLLKGQLQLLHNQLLYERHKREVHAERNRRLLGKTHKAKALEESNLAMQRQLQLLETEVGQLKAAFKLLWEENKQLAEANAGKDEIHEALMKKLQTENEYMRDTNEELQKLLVQHKQEVDKVVKELQASNAQKFTIQQDLDNARADVATNKHLKDEIARLNKELLLMGETNVKYQEMVVEMQRVEDRTEEKDLSWMSLKKDLTASQDALKVKNVQLEAVSARITEMEAILTQKDVAMADQKRFLENVKGLTKGKIEAMDSKYNALKKINQRQEAHILKLTKLLKEREESGYSRRRQHPASRPFISRSQSSTSQTDVIHRGARSESSDPRDSLQSRDSASSRPGKRPSSRTLERSQSHDETQMKADPELLIKTDSDFSLGSPSVRVLRENPLTAANQPGMPSSPRSSPMSDWENLSGETIAEATGRAPKEPAEAIRVPRLTGGGARAEDAETTGHLSVNSPPLVFSETSPFRPVQQSPRMGIRHSSFSPSGRAPIVLPGRIAITSGPNSRSCPNLKATVSPRQFSAAFPAQAEEEGEEGEEEEAEMETEGAVVDSVEPIVFHHGLASMLHMEASVEEADLSKS